MQRKDKVSRLPLRWRLRVADALMDGASYQEVRAVLRELGATDEQLPSDHSFNVFKDTEEFVKLVEQEIERYQLERRAAAAESMIGNMATVTTGNALKHLDWALADGVLTIEETIEALRAMTQFQSLQLKTVRERRLWGDTEGEPPALLRAMAGSQPVQMGVPVPYRQMRDPVYPEVPLAESLLDLDGLNGAKEQSETGAVEVDTRDELDAQGEEETAEPPASQAEAAASKAKETEVPGACPQESDLPGASTKQAEATSDEAAPTVASAASQAEAAASKAKETEVPGACPKESDLPGASPQESDLQGHKHTLSDPEPPTSAPRPAPVAEEPWVIIHPTTRPTHIKMSATAPCEAAAAPREGEASHTPPLPPPRQRHWDDDDDVGVGMLVRVGRRE